MNLKRNYLFGLPLVALLAFTSCSRDSNNGCFVPDPEPEVPSGVDCIPDSKPSAAIEADGFFIVNEDWFGTDNGTVNFFAKDGTVTYRAYRKANAGEQFGATTQFGGVYGDNIYFISKQENRFVVASQKDLKKQAVLVEVGGDGRSFQGISSDKGYLSTSDGISIIDLKATALVGPIDGIQGEVGDMCVVGNKAFANSKGKVFVINTTDDSLLETIELEGANSVLLAKDGNVWAGAGSTLYKIDPVSLESEKIDLGDNSIRTNPWAWTARSIDASMQSNTLYWTSNTSVVKFDMDTKSAQAIYTLGKEDDTNLEFYGSGLRVDPLNEQIVVTYKYAGWSENGRHNWYAVLDNAGKVLKKAPMGDEVTDSSAVEEEQLYYWFPAMPLFKDMNAPEILLNQILVPLDETVEFDLSEKVFDADTFDAAISKTVAVKEGEKLITASIENNKLIVKGAATEGETELTLTVNSNGKIVTKTIAVIVAEDISCKK